jgi:hypothetical protein
MARALADKMLITKKECARIVRHVSNAVKLKTYAGRKFIPVRNA